MFSQIKSFVLFQALFSIASTSVLYQKRATLETSLFAYGGNFSGINVFYADGLAYIGYNIPTFASTVSNITFNADTIDSTISWTINSNTTSSITGSEMYILPKSATAQVGFVSTNGTLPTDAETTGFILTGTTVAYTANKINYQMGFWARESNQTGVWALIWNGSGKKSASIFPVVLKTTAPGKPN